MKLDGGSWTVEVGRRESGSVTELAEAFEAESNNSSHFKCRMEFTTRLSPEDAG